MPFTAGDLRLVDPEFVPGRYGFTKGVGRDVELLLC